MDRVREDLLIETVLCVVRDIIRALSVRSTVLRTP